MNRIAVLVIGDLASPSMQPVCEAVGLLADQNVVMRFAGDLSQARLDGGSPEWFADLVIVCQQGPDEHSADDVRRLFRRHPLARLVCCFGPWCESDGRTRSIWPLAVRVPARSTSARIHHELEVISGRRAPLPLTASRDEIFAFDAEFHTVAD